MSIMSWFRHVTSGDPAADLIEQPIEFGEGEEQFNGLNMREALDAHIAWTRRLEGKLNGENDELLEPEKVASDCECTLGKWLHGQARRDFGATSDYEELRRVHAEFHLKAGDILNNVISGEHADAQGSLKQLRRQSGNVQLALARLYSHAQH